jgi:hypothetical protein
VLRKLKDALDDDVFVASGGDTFAQARKAKTDFEGGLSRAKISKFDSRKKNVVRDILENKIGPDELTDKVVFGRSWRPEDLEQLKAYVSDSGADVFDDLRADVMDKIKSASFIGPEDASGLQALSRDKLEKQLVKLGLDNTGKTKLNVLFKPDEIKFLKDMLKVSRMREPVRGTALGKGPSAQAVASLEQKLKTMPVIGFLVDVVNIDAAGRTVMKGRPDKLLRQAGRVERAIPSTLAGAGVAAALSSQKENQQPE